MNNQTARVHPSGRGQSTYHLSGPDGLIGELKVRNIRSHGASARVGGMEWIFYRPQAGRRGVRVKNAHTGEDVAHLARTWKSHGALQVGNRIFQWKPANASWTTWKWEDEHGNEIVRVGISFHLFDMRGHVIRGGAASHQEEAAPYLALLGWYLLLTHYQDMSPRLATRVRSAVGKLLDKIVLKNI